MRFLYALSTRCKNHRKWITFCLYFYLKHQIIHQRFNNLIPRQLNILHHHTFCIPRQSALCILHGQVWCGQCQTCEEVWSWWIQTPTIHIVTLELCIHLATSLTNTNQAPVIGRDWFWMVGLEQGIKSSMTLSTLLVSRNSSKVYLFVRQVSSFFHEDPVTIESQTHPQNFMKKKPL